MRLSHRRHRDPAFKIGHKAFVFFRVPGLSCTCGQNPAFSLPPFFQCLYARKQGAENFRRLITTFIGQLLAGQRIFAFSQRSQDA